MSTSNKKKPIDKCLSLSLAIMLCFAFSGYTSCKAEAETTGSSLTDCDIGSVIIFGSYEQDNDEGNGKENIEWLVLDKDSNKALIISKYALDCVKYNTESASVTWETCTIRNWLNSDFISSAFSAEEQANIALTAVTADKNPEYATDPGNDTEDKIFLLSIVEADKYFESNEARMCVPTAYAKAQGVSTTEEVKTVSGEETCFWWLRTPGDYQGSAACVYNDGWAFCYGDLVDYATTAVRPAMWVKLED